MEWQGLYGGALMNVGVFVFLSTQPQLPPLRLSPREVSAVRWVPLSYFKTQPQLDSYRITWDYLLQGSWLRWASPIVRLVGGDLVRYPCVLLPPETPADDPALEFRLWGLTLSM